MAVCFKVWTFKVGRPDAFSPVGNLCPGGEKPQPGPTASAENKAEGEMS